MKYIKTYEDNNIDYKKGDYVLFFDPDSKTYLPGKIVVVYFDHMWSYRIDFNSGFLGLIDKNEIIRLLTPEEIENFDAQKIAKKYNI